MRGRGISRIIEASEKGLPKLAKKMELLIQCVPAFLLALHWRGLRARPVLVGLVVGTLIACAGLALGTKRIGGVHLGVIGLAGNGSLAIAGSWWLARRGDAGSREPGAA